MLTALHLWLPRHKRPSSVGEHHKTDEEGRLRKYPVKAASLSALMCSSESDLEGSGEVLDAPVVYDMNGATKLSGSSGKKKKKKALLSVATQVLLQVARCSGERNTPVMQHFARTPDELPRSVKRR